MPSDPGHEFMDTLEQLCGQDNLAPIWKYGDPYPPPGNQITNGGFATSYATSVSEQTNIIHHSPPPPQDIGDVMCCFDTQHQLPVMYTLATQFAICDNWHSSIPGPTWPNRFFAYASSSNGMDDSPSLKQIMDGELFHGFSFNNGSVFDLLRNHKMKYRLYQDRYSELSFPIVQSLQNIHWRELNDISTFESDLASNYDYALTLIEPNYGDIVLNTYKGGSSQHPMDGMQKGEALIKKVYEAILNSPVWENSLLIITYDEHGGFYDHVAPGVAHPPDDGPWKYNKHGFDFKRYGVRVPAVVVSPYIPAHTVAKTEYDHTTMIRTVRDVWSLPKLTDRDENATGLSALLTLSQPRAKSDCPSNLSLAAEPEIEAVPLTEAQLAILDTTPLPESGNIIGFLQIAMKTNYEMSPAPEAEKIGILNDLQQIHTVGDAGRYMQDVLGRMKG